MANKSPTSPLHRLLKIQPGLAPKWLSPRNSCEGFGLLDVLAATPLLAAIALGRRHGWGPGLLAAALYLPMAWLSERFNSAERWGRARRRRGECPSCGRAGIGAETPCECGQAA
ncbi:hypothetical protein [Paludisphaera soli]|uniref:hypothetical protein n=1 Tax=Paludisphaera soli TaxID=2712865 RepID=UPI0013EADDF3|nr:hypothetical protein [Paludisphaera soli]